MNTDNSKEDDSASVCANCGKEGSEVNNTCNKCNMVKYCNAACKKKHRSKHKKQCERYVAEKHDKELFKQPPPKEDCPICFLLMPALHTGSRYMECCGMMICSGCIFAPLYDDQGNEVDGNKCPFCRAPFSEKKEEMVERLKQRVEAGDPIAMHCMGCYYRDGTNGCRQDYAKALKLWHQSAELGNAEACTSIGHAYNIGEGVDVDKNRAISYYERAAMGGDSNARHCLGSIEEEDEGNLDRALKHYMISARSGFPQSLQQIKELYSTRHATKEDYMKALQSYQTYLGEIKSKQRDEAAAYDGVDYRYY